MSAVITTQLLRVAQEAQRARAHVMAARTIEEVVRASRVTVPAHLRALTHSLPEIRALRAGIDQRLQMLVEEQLRQIEKLPAQARKEAIGRLKMRDWNLLRGDHASVLSLALRRASQLQVIAERELASMPQAPGCD